MGIRDLFFYTESSYARGRKPGTPLCSSISAPSTKNEHFTQYYGSHFKPLLILLEYNPDARGRSLTFSEETKPMKGLGIHRISGPLLSCVTSYDTYILSRLSGIPTENIRSGSIIINNHMISVSWQQSHSLLRYFRVERSLAGTY